MDTGLALKLTGRKERARLFSVNYKTPLIIPSFPKKQRHIFMPTFNQYYYMTQKGKGGDIIAAKNLK